MRSFRCLICLTILLPLVVRAAEWEFSSSITAGTCLTPANAAVIETALAPSSDDLSPRARLLGYYNARKSLGDAAARAARLKLIEWLIENAPASTLFHYPAAQITAVDFTGSNAGEPARLSSLWQRQVETQRDDLSVLENAASCLAQVDFDLAVRYATTLRQSEPTDPQWPIVLAGLYTFALTGAALPGHTAAESAQITAGLRTELQNSNDSVVTGLVGQSLYLAGKPQKSIPLMELGISLRSRAAMLDPSNPRWSGDPDTAPATLQIAAYFDAAELWTSRRPAPLPLAAGGIVAAKEVQAKRLMDHPAPMPLALTILPALQLKAEFEAVLGADGHVRSLRPMNGASPLMQAGLDAIRHWTYQPVLQNGKPVEVSTQIEISFVRQFPRQFGATREEALPPSLIGVAPVGVVGGIPGGVPGGILVGISGGAPPPPPPPPPPVREGSSAPTHVMAANRIKNVAPVYPPLAKSARVQGDVKFLAVIGKDGTVQKLTFISGHPLLVQAARDAAIQWTYTPITLNGEPVEVFTDLTVHFTLTQ